MTNDYQYQPLGPKKIRLLRLNPGRRNQDLAGSIFQTMLKNPTYIPSQKPGCPGHLEHDVPYEAVSYHWGRDLAKPFILVIDDGSVIRLSEELHAILQTIVDPAEKKTVWVDAICINQVDKNSKEKEEQIQLMPEIYRIAKRVRVHLGQERDHSDLAIQYMSYITGGYMTDMSELPKDKLKNQTFELRTYGSDKESNALCAFWERPWFRRIWVIQEFVYATDIVVFCGNTEVDWVTMFSVAKFYRRIPAILFSGQRFDRVHMQWNWLQAPEVHGPGAGVLCFYKMCLLRLHAWGFPSSFSKFVTAGELEEFRDNAQPRLQTGKLLEIKMPYSFGPQEINEFMEAAKISLSQKGQGEPFPKISFSELLFDSNQYLFTNPKDRFYALLALGTNTEFQEFEAKYSDLESVENVCYRFTVRLLLNGHCGEVLSLAGCMSRQSTTPAKRPSWIPDWTVPAKSLRNDGQTMCLEMALHRRWMDVEFDRLMNQVETKGAPTWQDEYASKCIQRSIAALKRLNMEVSDFERTNEDSEGGLVDYLVPEYRIYRASLESKPECQIQGKKLLIKGSRVDCVILVLPGALDRAPLFYEDVLRVVLKEYPTKEPLIEAVWRTLIANRAAWAAEGGCLKAPDGYREDFRLAKFRAVDEVIDICSKEGCMPPDFFRSLTQTRGRYKMCVTYGGYIGLLPLNAKFGDEIAVFHGCDTPFVIRRSAIYNHRTYTVIGECYIHGMMDGELFESPRFPVETIKIH